ncbi:MAG: DUF4157 domain-containing protein [Archaeoglobus sp.]|nr:DUF4157 domain-containing protein [Archaeoglobus sp.]
MTERSKWKIIAAFSVAFSIVCIVLVFAFLSYSYSNPSHTSLDKKPSIQIIDSDYCNKTQQLFEEVVERVSEIRGYTPDVPLEIVTKEWVVKKWGSSAIDKEALKDEEVFYKSLLLVPSNFSFEARKNKEVGGFMAFFWENKVYVVKENFDPDSKSAGEALAHELEHVVQDMYFNIKHDMSFDGDKAYGAVIEGDAVLMGWLYAGKDIEEEIREINSSIKCSSEPNRGYEKESNLNYLYFFPYTFGTEYIAKIYLKGGYKAVDEILRNPPTTTAQILHPTKKINLTNVKLNDSDFLLDFRLQQHRVVKDTRMGEFFIYLFLSSHLEDCRALKAAEGWKGDNLKILRNGNEFVYYWKILFDSKSDVEEFESAFESMLKKIGYKQNNCWIADGKYVKEKIKIIKRGNEVLIAGHGEV